MGCHSYAVEDFYVSFSESDEEFGCLCTFPHNDNEQFDINRIKSTALLGTMTVLVRNGHFDEHEGDYLYIPQDVPLFVLEAVRKLEIPSGT